MTRNSVREMTFGRRVIYASGELGVALTPAMVVGWLMYFYLGRTDGDGGKTVLVPYLAFAAINMLGRIIDGFADPLIGFFSDRTRSRHGRRRPWILIGAPFLSLFGIMLWYPPDSAASWLNIIWLAIGLGGFWVSFTVVVAPYISLLPEISRDDRERVELSIYMSSADIIGMLMATVGIGLLIKAAAGGLRLGPLAFGDGYKLAAWLLAIVSLLSFWLVVLGTREKPDSKAKRVPFDFFEAFSRCWSNPSFSPYLISIAFFRMSIDLLLAMIPFLVTIVMGYGEHVAGYLQGGIILLAVPLVAALYPLAERLTKRRVFLVSQFVMGAVLFMLVTVRDLPFFGWLVNAAVGGMLSDSEVMMAHVVVLFLPALLPIAVLFAIPRPMMADVIDMDTRLTGYRREAMYVGLESFVTKLAAGLAGVFGPAMLAIFGDTTASPWGILLIGPLCGFFLLASGFVFRYYPINK